MANAMVRWIGGKGFVGIDSSKHSVVLSSKDEGTGMKPSELLLVALGACTAVDVVEILQKKRQPPSWLEIEVEGKQEEDPPWTFRNVHVKYILRGKRLTKKAVAAAIQLSEQKYCSVAATVRGSAEITTEFEILEEEADSEEFH